MFDELADDDQKSLGDQEASESIQQVLSYLPKSQEFSDVEIPRIALMLVHGTIPPWASQNKDFFMQGNDVFEAIRSFAQELGDRENAMVEMVSIKWGGGNSDASRKVAGETLARILDGRYAGYKKIYTIAHSHGGNVVNVATNNLKKACIDTMIHLYTPAGVSQPKRAGYNRWFNLYSTGDMIQFAGSFQGWNIFAGGSSRKQNGDNVWNVRMQVNATSPGHKNKVPVMRNLYELITKIDGDTDLHKDKKWQNKVGRYQYHRDLEGHAFTPGYDMPIVVAIRHRDMTHNNGKVSHDKKCQMCNEFRFSDAEEVKFKQVFPQLSLHTKWYTIDVVGRTFNYLTGFLSGVFE